MAQRDWVANPPDTVEDWEVFEKAYVWEPSVSMTDTPFEEVIPAMQEFMKDHIFCEVQTSPCGDLYVFCFAGYRKMSEKEIEAVLNKKERDEESAKGYRREQYEKLKKEFESEK